MEFGYFEEFSHRAGRSTAEDFDEGLALAAAAERWGLDAVWLAELHCVPDRSVVAAPLILASAIAARTERIKVGTAVQVLPLGDPFRMAEESATIDQMSRGRLIFGVGRSSSPRSYRSYGIPYEESRERFDEALAVMLRAWTEPTFSFHGRYFNYEDVCLAPRPYQQPHPPIRVAINSAESFVSMGTAGYPVFVAVRLWTLDKLIPNVQAYREAWRAAGHPGEGEIYLRLPIYLAETAEQALEEPRESLLHQHNTQLSNLLAEIGKPTTLSYEEIVRDKAIVGTPDQVIDRLRTLRDQLSLDGVLAELNGGSLIPPDRVMNSLRLFCQDVAPALR